MALSRNQKLRRQRAREREAEPIIEGILEFLEKHEVEEDIAITAMAMILGTLFARIQKHPDQVEAFGILIYSYYLQALTEMQKEEKDNGSAQKE